MKRRVLITGACGFLGRHVAAQFKRRGCEVVGIGHGHWNFEKPEDFGIDEWIEADIDRLGLSSVKGHIETIIHCAGGSSVGQSLAYPFREFERTVTSAFHVLEYIREKHPDAAIIYPSSAAVYGEQPDTPITEKTKLAPVSPYGIYKKIVEGLCESYSFSFRIPAVVVRFFSIYGAGLKKQLLWDGCKKLSSGKEIVRFCGTGKETRDWLHVQDAAELVCLLADSPKGFEIYNGGSGERITVNAILDMLSRELCVSSEISMANEIRQGDPRHYWADISRVQKVGWTARYKIEHGLREYVRWFKLHCPKK